MDTFLDIIKHPFIWGFLLGLLFAAFAWKSEYAARRHASKEIKRVEAEMQSLQTHLNTQLKITASGNEALQAELRSLREQNETLRVNNAALQQKPGRAEQLLLQTYEIAIRTIREQVPGFAPAWEKALREAEQEMEAAQSGLKKLVRRVLPGLGMSSLAGPSSATGNGNAPANVVIASENRHDA